MKVRKIWNNDTIVLFQIYNENFCVNAILIDNEIKFASCNWDSTISVLDPLLQDGIDGKK